MKNTKKLLISVITVALSLIVVVGCMFTALAADIKFESSSLSAYNSQGYGSVDKGISVPGLTQIYKFYPSVQYGNPTVNGHPNLNFEEGWKYWVDTPNFKMNTETVDGKTNTFVTVVGEEDYKGIYGVRFNDSRIKPGDSIAVLYKWRAPSHQRDVEPKLIQLLYSRENDESTFKDEHQLVHGSADGRTEHAIWIADEEDDKEWNITLSRVYHDILDASIDYQPVYYYFLGMQCRKNVDFYKGTDIDDIQLVRYDQSTGLIYDLDGNQLYNLNNLPKREEEAYIWGDLSENDPDANIKVNVEDLIGGKIDLNAGLNDLQNGDDNSSEGIALWVWIVIAAGAVLILAAAAVVVIIVAKKKKAALVPAEETEVAEEVTEETTEE